ncbi:MAG TPA: hypothetical protein P5136_00695 [Methanofastidiosum sp.]|nr:hypothetical protein [Methanofastidiosum sp.]
MNVETLIKILEKEVKKEDRKNAEIEIWCDGQEFEISEMSGFSLSPDIVIRLKKITSSMLKPMVFKKEHSKKEKKMKEIIKKARKDK